MSVFNSHIYRALEGRKEKLDLQLQGSSTDLEPGEEFVLVIQMILHHIKIILQNIDDFFIRAFLCLGNNYRRVGGDDPLLHKTIQMSLLLYLGHQVLELIWS